MALAQQVSVPHASPAFPSASCQTIHPGWLGSDVHFNLLHLESVGGDFKMKYVSLKCTTSFHPQTLPQLVAFCPERSFLCSARWASSTLLPRLQKRERASHGTGLSERKPWVQVPVGFPEPWTSPPL